MTKINQYYSYQQEELPKGCQYCVQGKKLVLFVTGICPRSCNFCPVSDQKYQQDVTYANERKVNSEEDLLQEAELMQAEGAGITGGDPLAKPERTLSYIKLLKKKYGKQFHLHLYTSLNLVNEKILNDLYQAGLDEIRFHPDLEQEEFWPKLNLGKNYNWDVGLEIPLIPGKENETQKLLEYAASLVDFVNLNELEISDNEHSQLRKLGYTTCGVSYAVQGSLEMGLKLMPLCKRNHLCTAKLKDSVQLANRLKREAERAKNKFDEVDAEGLLLRGALYLPELSPGFAYRKKLQEADRKQIITKLNLIKTELNFEVILDENKLRLLTSRKLLRQNKDKCLKKGLKPALVKEYPTADQLEMEVQFI